MRGSQEVEERQRDTGSRREGYSVGGVFVSDRIGENSLSEMIVKEGQLAAFSATLS